MAEEIGTEQLAVILRTLGGSWPSGAPATDTATAAVERVAVTARLAGVVERLVLEAASATAAGDFDSEGVWPAVERHALDAGGWSAEEAPEVLARRGVRLLTAIDAAAAPDDPVMTAAGLAAAVCTNMLDAHGGLVRRDQDRVERSLRLASSALGRLSQVVRGLRRQS